ncbi:MAG: C40 family peptidase [Magnetococcales bacterium]|nr:C40 family peptidase [Magnetococcales bacterium]
MQTGTYRTIWQPLLLLALLSSGCSTQPLPPPQATAPRPSAEEAYRILEQRTPVVADRYEGLKYRLGANPDCSSAADCSNLVCAVTRTSLAGTPYHFEPYYMATPDIKRNSVVVPAASTRPGDLVFFQPDRSSKPNKQYHHVGIITKKRGSVIYFSHASSSQGVVETSTASTTWRNYWSRYFDSFRRWKPDLFSWDKKTTDTGPYKTTCSR